MEEDLDREGPEVDMTEEALDPGIGLAMADRRGDLPRRT